ncbi:hypothetical protein B484DRAFT_438087 [Ochromonadaceae sp. CCMP2298]|nr:hypothetical protein B484DRAFT_438087 [Ochromonadaceae sp. CCMP2298]
MFVEWSTSNIAEYHCDIEYQFDVEDIQTRFWSALKNLGMLYDPTAGIKYTTQYGGVPFEGTHTFQPAAGNANLAKEEEEEVVLEEGYTPHEDASSAGAVSRIVVVSACFEPTVDWRKLDMVTKGAINPVVEDLYRRDALLDVMSALNQVARFVFYGHSGLRQVQQEAIARRARSNVQEVV